MRTDDFDYTLPDGLIARYPAARREGARLMSVDRVTGARRHGRVADLLGLLRGDEVIVVNDTRVIPARVFGQKEASGGQVELLMLRPDGHPGRWHALGRTSKPLRPGGRVALPGGVTAVVCERGDGGAVTVDLHGVADVTAWLRAHGAIPLPPYLRRSAEPLDTERYQTVYAAHDGAVAAPTAGLHLTSALLDGARGLGCDVVPVTLHVGPGTFRPVTADDPREHVLDAEEYVIPEATAEVVARARRAGRPVLAVGTTVVRVLEHAARRSPDGQLRAGPGVADLLVLPGDELRVVDALMTNFHLPRSSLLMLVCAFAGRQTVLDAYAEAVARGYRFYSYGDATLWR